VSDGETIFDDASDFIDGISTLATTLGEEYGDAGGDAIDLGSDEESWQRWREMVWAFDDDEDKAFKWYGITAVSDNAGAEIGEEFVTRFNKAFFSGYVERIRRRLDDLES
jgi:hypothetical protein